jgi:uncharacterized protein
MTFPRADLILVLLFACFLGLQLYLYARLKEYWKRRLRPQSYKRAVLAISALLCLGVFYPLAWRAVFGAEAVEPAAPAVRGFLTVWVFGSAGLAVILVGCELWRRGRRYFSSSDPATPDFERRALLQKGIGMAMAAPFVVSGYGVLVGRHSFEQEHFELPVSGLSSSLSQFSIVQLTDVHAGPFMPAEELAEYVEAANRLKPDVIVLTGDFVSTRADEAQICVSALAGLRARHGVFACLGNHDVYARAEGELTSRFEGAGIRVLRNDAVAVRAGDTALNILGIDDLRSGAPDLDRALERAARAPGEVKLLLSHRPEIFPAASRRGIQVVLSGHYHGGQVKLGTSPASLSVARLMTPYAEGLFRLSRRAVTAARSEKDSVLFVSRGVGITALPIRINCPPQIAHLTLRKA